MPVSRSAAALLLVALACIGVANGADAGSARRRNNRRNRDIRDRAHANAGNIRNTEQPQDQRELFHRLQNEEIIIGRGGVEKVIKLPTHANGGPKPKVDGPDDEAVEPSDT